MFPERHRFSGVGLLAIMLSSVVALPVAAQCLDYGPPGVVPEVSVVDLLPDGIAADVTFAGDLAWVARSEYGALVGVDISDPTAPAILGIEPVVVMDEAYDVAVSGDLAFITYLQWGPATGVRIFAIGDPTDPVDIGNFQAPAGCWTSYLAVNGVHVYVSFPYTVFGILDVSDPAAPVLVGQLAVDHPGKVVVSDSVAYLLNGAGVPLVIDVSDATAPAVIGTLPVTGEASDICITAGRAHVVTAAGLEIIDVTDPAGARPLGSLAIEGIAVSVAVSGSITYVGTRDEVVAVVDTSMPEEPMRHGTVDLGLPGFSVPWTVAEHDGSLAVVAGGRLRLAPAQCPLVPAGAVTPPPPVLRLEARPNPFNPVTDVVFTLPRAARVTLTIHDLAGRRLRTILSGADHQAGLHRVAWQGCDDAGRSLPSGIYRCRLQADGQVTGLSLTLVR